MSVFAGKIVSYNSGVGARFDGGRKSRQARFPAEPANGVYNFTKSIKWAGSGKTGETIGGVESNKTERTGLGEGGGVSKILSSGICRGLR